MHNENNQAAPAAITDADVIRFLAQRRAEIRAPDVTFQVYISPVSFDGNFLVTCSGQSSASGPSSAAVVAEFNAKIKTPADVAAQKRAEAAKLLAEAAALAPIETPAPVAASQEVAA